MLNFFPNSARATSTISCHCFKDRNYDPKNPEKTDTYILATAHNSFMAATYSISKREVIQARMKGVSAHNLWVAIFAAKSIGKTPGDMIAARKQAPSWTAAFKNMKIDLKKSLPVLASLLEKNPSDEELSMAVVDLTLFMRFKADEEELRKIRSMGATNKEAVISFFLAKKTRQPASVIFERVKSKKSTWGRQVDQLGLLPGSLGLEIDRMLD